MLALAHRVDQLAPASAKLFEDASLSFAELFTIGSVESSLPTITADRGHPPFATAFA